MDILELSDEIYKLQKKRVSELGSELTPELVFMHLSEEIGEIARQLVNKNLKMRKYDHNNLIEEITQSMLDLLVLSKIYDIDLPVEVRKKIEEMKSRQKKEF
ncbi:MAG: hypothetical protein NTX24_03480 [Candidatus Pacearchaeota archaeon]|nr:hypothetical protein [Candidatus Pacearchaeota archaeon]